MYRVILYGCGERCKKLLNTLPQECVKIICLVDENPSKWGKAFQGHEICSPKIISKYHDVEICITIGNERDKQKARNTIKSVNDDILRNEIDYNKLIIGVYSEYYKLYEKAAEIGNRHAVLFDCHNGLVLGGIEEWTKSICIGLVEKGLQDTYIISPHGKYSVPQLISDKVLYVDIDYENRFGKKAIESIINCIMKYMPCTVVTCHIDEILIAASILKLIYPNYIKIVSVIHGGYQENYIGYFALDEFIDLYVGVSREIQEALLKRGIESTRVLHMTCPVKCDKELIREYTTNPMKPLKLGYAGRVEISQKRMDLLLKMIDSLEKKKVNYVLMIAGEGSALQDICNFIEERKLNNKVICLGKIDRSKIPGFWQSIDVCVNIADFEGRSISIMEAMSSGAVPVVTATSGVREDISDGENGYIVEIGNYDEMADRIEELSMRRDRLKMFGQKSHDVIYSKAQIDRHIEFWQKLLKNMWM
ncbi:MAG: glycosyltransferase [Roseburia sp.]